MAGAKLSVAVIGLGRAGRARVRALEDHPRAALAAVARSTPGAGEPSFADAVADASIDAAIVCTPNLLHAAQVRALLRSGKHTAVEFPLAPSADEARALFELARERERVLHVEHVELLSAGQRVQRERVQELGRPRGGELQFSGQSEGWIGDDSLAGSPGLRALARLHRLVDLFGEAEIADASLERRAAGYRLALRLAFRAGGETTLVESRGPDLPRARHWEVHCERGSLDDPPRSPERRVFARDLECFLDRIERGGSAYVSEARILHVLELVEQVDRLTARPPV